MRAGKPMSIGVVLLCLSFGTAGCSWIFFERVPPDGYPTCDEPDCSGRALATTDTLLAAGSLAYALSFLAVGLAEPNLCLGDDGFLCAQVSEPFYILSGAFLVPALVFGLSAGFGHAWAADCEAAWDTHQTWLDGRAEPPASGAVKTGQAEAGDADQAPALAHAVDDVDCPPGARTMGTLPPRGWERYCVRIAPSGLAVRHGPARAWFEDGRVASEGAYEDGQRHGGWTFWYGNGQVRLEANYQRGQKTGRWKRWSRDGQVLKQP